MTDSISAISSTAATSASSASSSAPKLTDDTKSKLQALGVDTTSITTEAQGQIALLVAQQQQQTQTAGKPPTGGGKEQMEAIKAQATSLASKLGVSVSADEKLPEIMAAIAPALTAKSSAAGEDQIKIAEVQELQGEYDSISSTLSNMEAQKSQTAQNTQKLDNSLSNMATQNKVYHQV